MSLATGGFTKFPFGRTVSESAEIQLIADSARLQWERFDDIYAALSWRLGHDGPAPGEEEAAEGLKRVGHTVEVPEVVNLLKTRIVGEHAADRNDVDWPREAGQVLD